MIDIDGLSQDYTHSVPVAQVWWKWAGLAVLFSRQILNRSLEFKILVVKALDSLSK